ncbi:MAG: VTT domain-containing protein [Pirellulales bacterium]|nr:VTT domain-containing protein [Pirellulales bacterium]
MRDLLKPILLVLIVLLIPILPFIGFGPWLEKWIESQLRQSLPPVVVAAAVVGLLSTDVFLPIPSSVVSTVAGNALGIAAGAAASWAGMTLGAALGFALARAFGRPLAMRFAGREDLERIDRASDRFGPLVLVLARPVPVLAEASVLFLGTTRLGWTAFFLPVALSNLGIAVVYAALGNLVQLPIAVAASIALPLVAAAVARRFWPKEKEP